MVRQAAWQKEENLDLGLGFKYRRRLLHGLALNDPSQVNAANTSFDVIKIQVTIYVEV